MALQYIQQSMSYTQLLLGTVNVECVCKHMAYYQTLPGSKPSSVHIVFFSILSCPFLFYFRFSLFWRHVECACLLCYGLMFRLVVSGPVSLSRSTFFAALILGFVCSIWAKFSNGDYNRGRPGERRRWVLPFLIE